MKTPFRVIVAGGRHYQDYALTVQALDHYLQEKLKTHAVIVVSGGASGADALGERYAKERGLACERFPAEWDKYGKSAGYRRNTQMAEVADVLVAFWDGASRGTGHMIDIARDRGLPTRVVRYDQYEGGN